MEITSKVVSKWLYELYHFEGLLSIMPGDEDLNYRFQDGENNLIVKVSNGKLSEDYLDFQTKILMHLKGINGFSPPMPIINKKGNYYESVLWQRKSYWIRVISWIEGQLWSNVTFLTQKHYISLGEILASYNLQLKLFDHSYAHRNLDWDLNQADWVKSHFNLFNSDERNLIKYFFRKYQSIKSQYKNLRKSVIHNDANDHNIIIDKQKVVGIIDFGDAIYTQVINDLAIAVTYALMDAPDMLEASRLIVKGFHQKYPLQDKELACLYTLVGVRLIISLTKARYNYQKDPSNTYHQVSATGGWRLIKKWKHLSEKFLTATLFYECGYEPFASFSKVKSYLEKNKLKCNQFFGQDDLRPVHISFEIRSPVLGLPKNYLFPANHQRLLDAYMEKHDVNMVYGGYLECRPFYTTEAFSQDSLLGIKNRTIHLGEDYWLPAGTPIFTPISGRIIILKNNAFEKDYGPTIVLEHQLEGDSFYTLYGHLDSECLDRLELGQELSKGSLLAHIGNFPENGNWAPHLHFQIMLDLLGERENFPGVAHFDEIGIWEKLCPDPKYLIDLAHYSGVEKYDRKSLIKKRTKLTSTAMSLSYEKPLHIVRGDGAYLIDDCGQRYLDLVNNVAHVGHENPTVVKSGQNQMALLNTNSRYLHEAIIEYAETLLTKFPSDYKKVFFVNSGSEANDLALRMARTISGSNDILALRHGYHGHTQSTLDVSSYKFDGKGGKGKPENTHLIDVSDDDLEYNLEKIINSRENKHGVAGFISESILSCAGQVVPDSAKMRKIYKSVKEQGGINIADEVQTGFGRVGTHFWAFELHGLDPDIVTLGKPMGNGHPIGALVCKGDIVEKFENGMEFFSTFGGNPVSCVIGKAVLDIVEEEKLQEHAYEIGQYLKKKLDKLADRHSCIHEVRGYGLFIGVEFRHEGHPDAATCNWVVEKLKEKKVLLSTDGPFHNVIKIKPPMIISHKDIDIFISNFNKLLKSWY